LCLRIFRSFNVNASRWTGGGTEEATNTFFQAALIAMKNVDAAVTGLEMDRLFGIIFGDGLSQHVAECHTETLYQGKKSFASFLNDR
jgi:hypothetical protein